MPTAASVTPLFVPPAPTPKNKELSGFLAISSDLVHTNVNELGLNTVVGTLRDLSAVGVPSYRPKTRSPPSNDRFQSSVRLNRTTCGRISSVAARDSPRIQLHATVHYCQLYQHLRRGNARARGRARGAKETTASTLDKTPKKGAPPSRQLSA